MCFAIPLWRRVARPVHRRDDTHRRWFLHWAPTLALLLSTTIWAPAAAGQTLSGGSASLDRQNRQARAHDFSYLRTPSAVRNFVNSGLLVRLTGNANYTLNEVSYPYARVEVKLFVERLSSQFRGACGEQLVVTSLTRPRSRQPFNASTRSVHPTGMAVDLRRHNTPSCRTWLERVLLSLENSGVLEATLERYPPHYHVAIYPNQYRAYVGKITGGKTSVAKVVASSATTPSGTTPPGSAGATPATGDRFADVAAYTVRRGDTLWSIAQRHGSTPTRIKEASGLRSTLIHPGQRLNVPLTATAEH